MSDAPVRCSCCGAEFHCGAADPSQPCACTTVKLDSQVLAALRERYTGCLCLPCLASLSFNPPAPPAATPHRGG